MFTLFAMQIYFTSSVQNKVTKHNFKNISSMNSDVQN